MELIRLLKKILEQGDYLFTLDLKDAYFCVLLNKQSRKYVRFEWAGSLYKFLCLCFGLGSAPSLFIKLIKVPVSVLCKLYIWIIVCLGNFLILWKTLEETILSRDTVIYLLQNLGFVINLKKSVLHPTQRIEFVEMIIDSLKMTSGVPASEEDRVDFQKVSGYIVNAGGVNKRPSKAFNSISNSSCTIIHEVPAETTNL